MPLPWRGCVGLEGKALELRRLERSYSLPACRHNDASAGTSCGVLWIVGVGVRGDTPRSSEKAAAARERRGLLGPGSCPFLLVFLPHPGKPTLAGNSLRHIRHEFQSVLRIVTCAAINYWLQHTDVP